MVPTTPDIDDDFSAFDEGAKTVAPGKGRRPKTPPEGAKKVELDLVDAPFLEQRHFVAAEPAPPRTKRPISTDHRPTEQTETDDPEQAEERAAPKKLPLLHLASALAAALVLITIAIFLFLPSSRQSTLPPGEIPHLVALEPFFIEQQGTDGLRFLQCRFTLPAGAAELEHEIRTKQLLIRDALYQYLTSREPAFLTREEETVTLKGDLLTVINQFLTSGRLQDILINEYVIR
jgi:flagellar protein FliL